MQTTLQRTARSDCLRDDHLRSYRRLLARGKTPADEQRLRDLAALLAVSGSEMVADLRALARFRILLAHPDSRQLAILKRQNPRLWA